MTITTPATAFRNALGASRHATAGFERRHKRQRRAAFIELETILESPLVAAEPCSLEVTGKAWHAMAMLQTAGFQLVVFTQSRALAAAACLDEYATQIGRSLTHGMRQRDLSLADFLYCPHQSPATALPASQSCACFQPHAGLILQAARDQGLTLRESWCIATTAGVVSAATLAGCQTVLLGADHTVTWPREYEASAPVYIASDVAQGVDMILQLQPRRPDMTQAPLRIKRAWAC